MGYSMGSVIRRKSGSQLVAKDNPSALWLLAIPVAMGILPFAPLLIGPIVIISVPILALYGTYQIIFGKGTSGTAEEEGSIPYSWLFGASVITAIGVGAYLYMRRSKQGTSPRLLPDYSAAAPPVPLTQMGRANRGRRRSSHR